MKKIVTSLVFLATFGGYTAYHYFSTPTSYASSSTLPQNPANPLPAQNPNPITSNPPAPSHKPITKSTPTPATKPRGQYADGTYTGSVADAYYGNIQVQAIISNGAIADVQFLQYPNDRSTSRFINGQAMPILRSEAIQSQSANVDIVSGATDTSGAFVQSLSDALSQARS